MCDKFQEIKKQLLTQVESQMAHLECVDTKEMGEVIDMIKDLEEAIYYCTITEAMNELPETTHYYTEKYKSPHKKRIYKPMTYDYDWEDYDYDEHEYEMPTSGKFHETHDSREGRSGVHRKMYIEAKELHKDKSVQIKELDKYLQELSSDIVEMIEDASNDERSYMEKKIQALASKIGSMNG